MQIVLFRTSDESEARILTAIGMLVVACAAGIVAVFAFGKPLAGKPRDQLGILIDTPFIGHGVAAGTPVVMHGVKVGEVTRVTSLPGNALQLEANLQRGPTAGLTDAMVIDFRPSNYFGVTGINLAPGQGGQLLTEGALIKAKPSGDFTLQALLSRLGQISHGVITPRLIDTVDRATHYADGLDPLLETMLTVANSVANVQSVSTERLLKNTAIISAATPGVVSASEELGNKFVRTGLETASEDFYRNSWNPSMDLIAGRYFGLLGNLESSHSTELLAFINVTKTLTDIIPGLIPPEAFADTARQLRERIEHLFTGPPDRRAVNTKVILDDLPGVAAPINALGVQP